MIRHVINKVLSFALDSKIETLITFNEFEKRKYPTDIEYILVLAEIDISEESLNKVPSYKRIAKGVALKSNPFLTYDIIGLLYPTANNNEDILDKWILAYHKIQTCRSFLKVTMKDSKFDIDGAIVDYLRKFDKSKISHNYNELLTFSLPLKIKLKLKVKESEKEEIALVQERKVQLIKQVQ